MSNKKLIFALLIVIIPTLLLITYLIVSVDNSTLSAIDNKEMKDTIRFEMLKNLLQLFIVMIIGGIVAFFFKSREEAKKEESVQKKKEQEVERNRNEIRIDYFNRLGKIYRDVKSIRRILVAEGITSGYKDPPSIMSKQQIKFYCEQMKLLNDNQLLLECLKVEAMSIPEIVKLQNVEKLLFKMEDYLREILNEYEEIKKKETIVNYSNLIKLDEFTNLPEYGFFDNFSTPYRTIIKTIGENLI